MMIFKMNLDKYPNIGHTEYRYMDDEPRDDIEILGYFNEFNGYIVLFYKKISSNQMFCMDINSIYCKDGKISTPNLDGIYLG